MGICKKCGDDVDPRYSMIDPSLCGPCYNELHFGVPKAQGLPPSPENLTADAIVLVGEHLIRAMWAINATLAADGNNLKANMQSVIDSAEAEWSGFRAAAEKMGDKDLPKGAK